MTADPKKCARYHCPNRFVPKKKDGAWQIFCCRDCANKRKR